MAKSVKTNHESNGNGAVDTHLFEITITPLEKEALALRQQGLKYEQIAQKMASRLHTRRKSRQAVYDMLKRAQRKLSRLSVAERYTVNPQDCPVAETPITARVRLALKRAGFERIGQLAGHSREQLEEIKGVGQHGAFQIYSFIEGLGIQRKTGGSFCPKCGTASSLKLGGKRPLNCETCGYKTAVKVIEEPEPVGVG